MKSHEELQDSSITHRPMEVAHSNALVYLLAYVMDAFVAG